MLHYEVHVVVSGTLGEENIGTLIAGITIFFVW